MQSQSSIAKDRDRWTNNELKTNDERETRVGRERSNKDVRWEKGYHSKRYSDVINLSSMSNYLSLEDTCCKIDITFLRRCLFLLVKITKIKSNLGNRTHLVDISTCRWNWTIGQHTRYSMWPQWSKKHSIEFNSVLTRNTGEQKILLWRYNRNKSWCIVPYRRHLCIVQKLRLRFCA